MTVAWYEELREQYRPETIEILLVGESPPDPGAGDKRFFYAPTLTRYDNLYRGVAGALYGPDIKNKPLVLKQLKQDGFWLIDALETPVNRHTRASRRAQIREAAPRLAQRCKELAPGRGVIICHGLVFELCAATLRDSGVRVLHDEPLQFPLGNWRTQFVERFQAALDVPNSSRRAADRQG